MELSAAAEDAELHERRGNALRGLNRFDEALSEWLLALERYESAGEDVAATNLRMTVGPELFYETRFAEAVGVAEGGLAAAVDGAVRGQLLALVAAVRASQLVGEADESARLRDEALRLVESSHDGVARGRVYFFAGIERVRFGEFKPAAADFLRAVDEFHETGQIYEEIDALFWASLGSFILGNVRLSEQQTEAVLERAAELGNSLADYFCSCQRAALAFLRTGDSAVLRENVPASGGRGWGAFGANLQALADFNAGDWESARRHGLEAYEQDPGAASLGEGMGTYLLCCAYLGDGPTVDEILRDFAPAFEAAADRLPQGLGTMLGAAVESLAILGKTTEAARLRDAVERVGATGRIQYFALLRVIETPVAIAQACAGDWSVAEESFRAALQRAHDMPNVAEQPEVRRWYAWMLLRRDEPDDRDHASRLLMEAIKQYRTLGMPKHRELAEQMLAEV